MAQGVNKVIIIGNLGADPEVKYTQSGTAVSNLRVAVGERKKNGDQWVDHTEWVSVVCFGKTAENVGQYLAKGRQIYVEGRISTKEYKDKEGERRWRTEVIAREVRFLGSRGQGGGGGGSKPDADKSSGGGGTPSEDDGFYDDDLPF